METEDLSSTELYSARNYQLTLFKKCIESNTIVFLPTGAGKTFIAVMVLKHMAADLIGEDHKISVLLVNTVALVYQHSKYISNHTTFKVGSFSGEMGVDFWDSARWHQEFKTNQVIIMTSQILCNLVTTNILDLNRVNLIIFDECHQGVSNHSMRQLMISFQYLKQQPRVIGLTATLLNGNCKSYKVMDEVRDLEVTYHSKVATASTLHSLIGFSTNPMEKVLTYKDHSTNLIEEEIIQFLSSVENKLRSLKFKSNKLNDRLCGKAFKKMGDDDFNMKKICNILFEIIFEIKSLGLYSGKLSCSIATITIEKLKVNCEQQIEINILNYAQTMIQTAHAMCLDYMKTFCEKDDILQFSSNKLNKLFEIFDNYTDSLKEKFCGIIFVQRKTTAKLLFHILHVLSTTNEKYAFIKPNFIIGNNNNPNIQGLESLYLSKKNREILMNFENKEINLLVSTQVLEEGVDIPNCSFVCKFDPPNNYRSYVQSKGRGRHKDSRYIIFINESEVDKFVDQYNSYQEMELFLNQFLVGKSDERTLPSKKELDEFYNEDLLPPYFVNGPNSAFVNLNAAIPLLHMYCDSLYEDKYIDCDPEWYKSGVDKKFSVTILMPAACPLTEPITGPMMANIKLAKKAAALQACIELHKCNELDDNLRPAPKIIKEEDVAYLFKHHPPKSESEKDAGIKKTRLHDIFVPESTKGPIIPDQPCYLHIIDIVADFDSEKKNVLVLKNLYESNLCYGLITPKPLPHTFTFPLYITNGTLMVTVKENVKKLNLSEENLLIIKEFNVCVYNDILEVLKECIVFDNSDSCENLMLVAANKDLNDIDLNTMVMHRTIKDQYADLSYKDRQKFNPNQNYLNKIVIPCYRREKSIYVVTEILSDMSPLSNFPTQEYETFKNYFSMKYQLDIFHSNQPLLLVKGLSKKLNLFKPIGNEKQFKKEKLSEENEEKLIPELLVIQDFPASLWIQANLLPSILHRYSYMLKIDDLLKKIAKNCNFKLSKINRPLKLNIHLLKYEPAIKKPLLNVKTIYDQVLEPTESKNIQNIPIEKTQSKEFSIKVLESQYPWNNIDEPKDIERTLDVNTADINFYMSFLRKKIPSANEDSKQNVKCNTNYETPALKYNIDYEEKLIDLIKPKDNGTVELADIYEAMTTSKANDIVNLERFETLGDSFLKYISSFYIITKFPKFNEGKCTTLKGRLVSNKNLFYVAKNLDIAGRLKNSDLFPRSDWIPPGFAVPKNILQSIMNKTMSVTEIFQFHFSREEQISGEIKNDLVVSETENEVMANETQLLADNSFYFKKRCFKDKIIADAVEALLGVYLLQTGISGAIKVLEYFEIIPHNEQLSNLLKKKPPSAFKKTTGNPMIQINNLIPQWREVESILNYSFNDKSYLLEALTHASYSLNRLTASYERLEFLGDAVLDFLITCHLFEQCEWLTPGDLTDLRSALVNNNTFATLVVRNNLHKFMLLMNSRLQKHIDNFVSFINQKNFEIDDQVLILLEDDDLNIAEYIDVPKVLGDTFEALIGAVFLDTNYNLGETWKVIHKLMWKEIKLFSQNVPKNAVRKIYEIPGAYPIFSEPKETQNNRVMVTLKFMAKGRPEIVSGFGTNKLNAKRAAAKIALRRYV